MARAQIMDFFCGSNLAFVVFLILILLIIGLND
jgi:low affinity Fe/Cu permease